MSFKAAKTNIFLVSASTIIIIFAIVIPFAGTVAAVYFDISKNAASGDTWTIQVLHDGTFNTSMTCTIANGVSGCSDTSNTFTVAAGDLVSVKVTQVNNLFSVTGTASLHITSTP